MPSLTCKLFTPLKRSAGRTRGLTRRVSERTIVSAKRGSDRAAASACTASFKVRASGTLRSSPVSRNSWRTCGWAQTTCRLPPYDSARLATPTSTPSPTESMMS